MSGNVQDTRKFGAGFAGYITLCTKIPVNTVNFALTAHFLLQFHSTRNPFWRHIERESPQKGLSIVATCKRPIEYIPTSDPFEVCPICFQAFSQHDRSQSRMNQSRRCQHTFALPSGLLLQSICKYSSICTRIRVSTTSSVHCHRCANTEVSTAV